MAKLHRFSQSVEPIAITDSDDELDIVKDRVREEILFRRPTYQRQLGFSPPNSNESTEDLQNYDVLTSISLSKRLYDKHCWCEGRIQKLEATIAKFVRGIQVDDSKYVAGIYCLTRDQMEMFDDLKKQFLEPVRELKMFGYENYNSYLNRKLTLLDNAWYEFGNMVLN